MILYHGSFKKSYAFRTVVISFRKSMENLKFKVINKS